MKRLTRDGYVLPIPQVKDRPYLYMPNPSVIHPQSPKIQHYLGIADLYIQIGQPKVYEVEPKVNDEYSPDAYTRLDGEAILIELQRTVISQKRMQQKVDAFAESFIRKQHDAKTLWIVSDYEYKIKPPTGFNIIQKKPLDAVI
jgi:hypothetical protein